MWFSKFYNKILGNNCKQYLWGLLKISHWSIKKITVLCSFEIATGPQRPHWPSKGWVCTLVSLYPEPQGELDLLISDFEFVWLLLTLRNIIHHLQIFSILWGSFRLKTHWSKFETILRITPVAELIYNVPITARWIYDDLSCLKCLTSCAAWM